MKTRLIQCLLIVAGGILCSEAMAQTGLDYAGLPMNNSSLYDLDGDGEMELINFDESGGSLKFCNHLITGPTVYKTIPLGLYLPSLQKFSIQLLNLNNDFYPDIALQTHSSESFVSAAGYSNLCLLKSDENGEYVQVPETKVPYVVDVNQDGRTDILLSNNQYLIQGADGNFRLVRYEEVSEKDESVFSKWGADRDFTDNLGCGMGSDAPIVVSDAEPVIKTDWGNYGLDYNKDGKMDFIDPLSGKLMMNRGDNKYVASRLGSAVYVRDLNGDQVPDYVLYDMWTKTISTLIYHPDKGYVRSTLFSNMEMDEKIYFYDTDKDGDVDIMVPFSATESTKFTYIVVFVNDGHGNFTMEENSFEKNFTFLDCKDIDNDGCLDFVASADNIEKQSFESYLIRGKKGNLFVEEELPFDTRDNNGKLGCYSGLLGCIADIDNDGIAEVLLSGWARYSFNYESKVCKMSMATFNNAPDRMNAPSVLFNEKRGTLQISWEEGRDKESSSADLSYAIRIGSAPEKSDIYYAHANADGSRRNLQLGNMGYSRDVTLNTSYWDKGKYYISVQAIDPMFKGSVWSNETVFNHDCFYAGFTLDKFTTFSSDTVTVTLDTKPDHLCTYTWDWDGGIVLEDKTDDGICKVYWVEPGVKTVRLEVKRIADGRIKNNQQEIKIYGNSLEQGDRTEFDCSFDFNQDGNIDIFRVDGVDGFMKNDGKGKFSSLPGLFNTDIPNRVTGLNSRYDFPHVGDYDKDGLPDVMVLFAKLLYANKGNYKFNKGGIIFAPTVEDHDEYHIFDIDNDGNYDILKIYEEWRGANYTSSSKMYYNKGDNTFSEVPFSLKEEKINLKNSCLVDLNNDGYIDIIQRGGWSTYYKQNELCVLMNQGDKAFKVNKISIPNEYKDRDGQFGFAQYVTFADMNNDGYVDMVRCYDDFNREITIFYYDGSSFFNNVKRIPFPSDLTPVFFGSGIITADVDNNGYKDVIIPLDTYGTGVFYMYGDGHYELKINKLKRSNGCIDQFIDLNGDRVPDFIWADNRSKIKNEVPTVPQYLRATQTDRGTVLIEWDAASDKESPQSQLRYNLSVKKKGASGPGSFVISPMNDLKNEAAVIPSYPYISGTRYEIPLYAMPVGDYEIQIQSIDLWDEHSDMSPIYNFTVETQPLIKLPQAACTGKVAEISYIGTSDSELIWNWDGGIVSAENGNRYSIIWSTPGVKNISVTVAGQLSKASLKVKELADIVTNMTPVNYANQKQIFSVSSKGGKEQGAALTFMARKRGDKIFTDLSSHDIELISQSDTIYSIRYSQAGNYEIKLAMNDGFCIEKSLIVPVEVRPELPSAELGQITVAANGKNKLSWTSRALPEYIVSRVIYKETVKAGVYERLAVIPISQLEFTDSSFEASLQSYRYKSAYLTEDGVEGECGVTHKTIHLMINKSAVGGWNLVWNSYEGVSVSTYRIYRGETVDNLSMLAEVSGNANSYTDLSALAQSPYYYAIEVEINGAVRSSISSVRSNIQSTISAVNAISAEYMYILGLESYLELSEEKTALHLYAEIYPMMATYRTVNWQIVSGNEYAEIYPNGLLVAKPSASGTVVVRATAVDGSGVYAELSIYKQQTTGIDEVAGDKVEYLNIYPSPAVDSFTINGIPVGDSETIISICDVNGTMIYQEKTKENSVTINCSSFNRGFHIVRVQSRDDLLLKKIVIK